MPGMNGPDLQDELTNQNHIMPIIFVTGYVDIPSSVKAIKTNFRKNLSGTPSA
jgi:FixJ family two-component response regulator